MTSTQQGFKHEYDNSTKQVDIASATIHNTTIAQTKNRSRSQADKMLQAFK